MNRRDILKFATLGAVGVIAGVRPIVTPGAVASELLADQSPVLTGWRIADSSTALFSSFAKIVSCTDSTITVETYGGSDPIFVENGVVSTRKFVRADGELLLCQAWFTVHNYRPNTDGTQTWDIELAGGDIGDIVAQNIAYHYGAASDYENIGVYEVAGPSGWQL